MTSTLTARTRFPLSLIAPLALATLATACGGGEGGGDNRDPASVGLVPDSGDCTIDSDITGCGLGVSGVGTVLDGTYPAEAFAGPVPAGVDAVEIGADLADVPGSAFYTDANNSGRLQGAVIGDGSAFGETLSRSIPFRVETPSEALELLYMSAVPDGGAERSRLIGVVENRSDEVHCFISLEGTSVHDTRGSRIPRSTPLNVALVDGVVVFDSSGVTDGCIAPGDRAYVQDFVSASVSDIRSFSTTHIYSRTSDRSAEGARVEPVAYELDGEQLKVTIANRGSIEVAVMLPRVYLLDEKGHPVWTGLLRNGDWLSPGEEGVVWADVSDFSGSVSTVRVLVEFTRAG